MVLVQLTEKGSELLERLRQPLADLHNRQFEHMSREELEQLRALLERAQEKRRQA